MTNLNLYDKKTSIKKNFVYKSILTVSNYLMMFITFPYISRILGVDNIGLVNFVDNTINYFLLFASMGVGVLGIREIARSGKDFKERSIVFSNILGINLLFTFITLFVYFIIIIIVPRFSEYSELLYVGAAKILFTAFLIEWFYTGLEEFRYITFRNLLVKIIYIISVFTFVKSLEDYKLYFYLTISVTIINAFINIIYSHRYIKIRYKDLLNCRYLRENVSLGIYSIMTSMYLTFNVMYLGLVSNNEQVGFYTTAFKLYSVVLGFFTAFTNVMLPRMSALVANKDEGRFSELIDKSFSWMILFSFPLILCSMILAPQIIYILSGPGYEGAILPMRIIMPSMLFVAIAQVLAMQILMPLKKDGVLLCTSIIGAVVSLIINVLLVNDLKSIGSAIVLLCSEFIVTLSYVIYIKIKTRIKLPWINLYRGLLLSLPCISICIVVAHYVNNEYLSCMISIGLSAMIYIFIFIYRERVLENKKPF